MKEISLYEVHLIEVEKLMPRADNPHKMDEAEFNRLAESVEDGGFLEPLVVAKGRYKGKTLVDKSKYEILGGHRRREVAVMRGMPVVPCTVIKKIAEPKRVEIMVRLNAIKGSFDPIKFTELVNNVLKGDDYSDLIQSFLMDRGEFEKLYQTLRHELPPEVRDRLPATAEEIKTIDNLALILNKMFTEYGSTLDYHFMIFDWGGKRHIWV